MTTKTPYSTYATPENKKKLLDSYRPIYEDLGNNELVDMIDDQLESIYASMLDEEVFQEYKELFDTEPSTDVVSVREALIAAQVNAQYDEKQSHNVEALLSLIERNMDYWEDRGWCSELDELDEEEDED